MKKVSLFLCAALIVPYIISVSSCSKGNDDDITPEPGEETPQPGETKEVYIDATSSDVWKYYSFAKGTIIGEANDADGNFAAWSARKDWDVAIRRYNVRTNSGESTTAGAKGGVYAMNESASFASILKVSPDSVFVADVAVSIAGMGGVTTTVQSIAQVVFFKKDDQGSTIMPPVYLKTPVYVFRTADSKDFYKVSFTQYQNEEAKTGHVKFDVARIYQ